MAVSASFRWLWAAHVEVGVGAPLGAGDVSESGGHPHAAINYLWIPA